MEIVNYCGPDRTRFELLAGDRQATRALRDQIAAAYEGVASIDLEDLDDFDHEDWNEEELAFILGQPSDINRLEHRHRAEYLRARLKRPLSRREGRGAELSFRNILPTGRRKTRRPQVRGEEKEQVVKSIPQPRAGEAEEASTGSQERGYSSFLVDAPEEGQGEGEVSWEKGELGALEEREGERGEREKRPRCTPPSHSEPGEGRRTGRSSTDAGEGREGSGEKGELETMEKSGGERERRPSRTPPSHSKPEGGRGSGRSSPEDGEEREESGDERSGGEGRPRRTPPSLSKPEGGRRPGRSSSEAGEEGEERGSSGGGTRRTSTRRLKPRSGKGIERTNPAVESRRATEAGEGVNVGGVVEGERESQGWGRVRVNLNTFARRPGGLTDAPKHLQETTELAPYLNQFPPLVSISQNERTPAVSRAKSTREKGTERSSPVAESRRQEAMGLAPYLDQFPPLVSISQNERTPAVNRSKSKRGEGTERSSQVGGSVSEPEDEERRQGRMPWEPISPGGKKWTDRVSSGIWEWIEMPSPEAREREERGPARASRGGSERMGKQAERTSSGAGELVLRLAEKGNPGGTIEENRLLEERQREDGPDRKKSRQVESSVELHRSRRDAGRKERDETGGDSATSDKDSERRLVKHSHKKEKEQGDERSTSSSQESSSSSDGESDSEAVREGHRRTGTDKSKTAKRSVRRREWVEESESSLTSDSDSNRRQRKYSLKGERYSESRGAAAGRLGDEKRPILISWEYKQVVAFAEDSVKYYKIYNPIEHPAATLDKAVGAQLAMAWREMFKTDWHAMKRNEWDTQGAVKWLRQLKQLATATFMQRQLPSSFKLKYTRDSGIDASQAAIDILHLWEMNRTGMKRKAFVAEIISQIAIDETSLGSTLQTYMKSEKAREHRERLIEDVIGLISQHAVTYNAWYAEIATRNQGQGPRGRGQGMGGHQAYGQGGFGQQQFGQRHGEYGGVNNQGRRSGGLGGGSSQQYGQRPGDNQGHGHKGGGQGVFNNQQYGQGGRGYYSQGGGGSHQFGQGSYGQGGGGNHQYGQGGNQRAGEQGGNQRAGESKEARPPADGVYRPPPMGNPNPITASRGDCQRCGSTGHKTIDCKNAIN